MFAKTREKTLYVEACEYSQLMPCIPAATPNHSKTELGEREKQREEKEKEEKKKEEKEEEGE